MLGGGLRFSWKQFLTPSIVASVISLAVALTHTHLPAQIGEMLDMVGDVTVPLALMLVGSELAKLPLRQMLGGPRVWAVVIIRLLALPVLFSGVLLLLMDLPEMLYGVAVSQMAMPGGGHRHADVRHLWRRPALHGSGHLFDHGHVHCHHSHPGGDADVTDPSRKGDAACLTFNNSNLMWRT